MVAMCFTVTCDAGVKVSVYILLDWWWPDCKGVYDHHLFSITAYQYEMRGAQCDYFQMNYVTIRFLLWKEDPKGKASVRLEYQLQLPFLDKQGQLYLHVPLFSAVFMKLSEDLLAIITHVLPSSKVYGQTPLFSIDKHYCIFNIVTKRQENIKKARVLIKKK